MQPTDRSRRPRAARRPRGPAHAGPPGPLPRPSGPGAVEETLLAPDDAKGGLLRGVERRPAAGGPEGYGGEVPGLTEALRVALAEVPRLLPVRSACFYLVQETGATWVISPITGNDHAAPSHEIAAVVEEVVTSRRPALIPASGSRAEDGDTYVVPLLARTREDFRAVGAAVFSAEAGVTFSPEDLLVGALLVSQVAEAIHHRHLDQELERHQEVQRRLLAEVISAQENERKRIAADIHNDILQILGYNLLKVEIGQRYLELGDVERLRGEFDAMRTTLEESVQLLREIIFQLRPSTLDQRGLLATIDAHLARFEAETGVTVRFSSRLGRRLDPHLETLVYRLVQEALANVRKHSGATRASIALRGKDNQVQVVIEDNGKGFKVGEALDRSLGQGHIGLHSMRERAELVGGALVIESREGHGTRLTFTLPRSP